MIKLAAARMSEPAALSAAGWVASSRQFPRAWTDLPSPDSLPEDLHCEQLRLGTTAANYMCHAAIRDFFAGRRAVDSAKAHLAALAKLHLADGGEHISTLEDRSVGPGNLMDVAVLEKLVTDHPSELRRLSSAYTLGYMTATGDEATLATLLALAQCPVECARRSAWYGLTVGGHRACEALLELFAELPSELAMNAAHALGQAAAPVTTVEDHARAVRICNVLITRLQNTRAELLEYSGGYIELDNTGGTNRPVLPDFYATDRRRVMAECMAAIALLTQAAMRFTPESNSEASMDATKLSAVNSKLALAAAEALLPLLPEPEPGAKFPSYMAPEYCGWNAANAMLHICSAGTESRPSTPTFR